MSDWLWPAATVLATVVGPILAVQAQKAVERVQERRRRKSWVFHQLMATRASRLSPDHVQALNMIDLAFYGRRDFGKHRATRTEIAVTDAWHEYLDHLSTKSEDGTWVARSDELFTNLLSAMAKDVGYSFDRVQLKKGAYSPIAHGEQEQRVQAIRQLASEVLSGDRPIKMAVTNFPFSQEAMDAQVKLQGKLADALGGNGALRVVMVDAANNGIGDN
ncbi:MAG: hypothetical protein KGJ32_14535 [Xanthomonadaceae bacterium]|nr:hypothetical protein [Xanthomonadaceae bacterium]